VSAVSYRRLLALCRKETYQIVRDPTSVLIAFILPVTLLFIYGFALDLDLRNVRLGVARLDDGPAAVRFEQALADSGAFEVHASRDREALLREMARGDLRGVVTIPNDFSRRYLRGQEAPIQVAADGSEPNTSNFVASYVQGTWETWKDAQALDAGATGPPRIDARVRSWYNPGEVSRYFIVPGSIAIVMTIIGALLTSLVVAREWERGTMEALLSTPVTRTELLLSKILPYYVLGMMAMLLCLVVAIFAMGIPFRGSVPVLLAVTTLFLACALGQGLFISTVLRVQFVAAQAALTSAFLPALMLSGFVFEINSMPWILRLLCRFLPARHFTSSLQTLFQAGNIASLLVPNCVFLALLGLFWLTLTARKTRRTLD
jgi:ABC-2 type transport system permease protein